MIRYPSSIRVASRFIAGPPVRTSARKPRVVYAMQDFPDSWSKNIFLAGPTPRKENSVPSWRPEAIRILEELGFDGVVFSPEAEDGDWAENYDDQVNWERAGLNLADIIVFWVPRDLDTMPAFTTNVEYGRWLESNKTVLGHPEDAPKTRYLDTELKEWTNSKETPFLYLRETLQEAVNRIGDGAFREEGERHVPLYVWKTPMFQSWYASLKKAGNRLDHAWVRWAFKPAGSRDLFSWVLQTKIWIGSEERYKENEWVFARTDISAVVLWSRGPAIDLYFENRKMFDLLRTEVILVREFRSPGRTPDGFVHELPGGSSKENKPPEQVAREEVLEETGLKIASSTRLSSVRENLRQKIGVEVPSSRFRFVGDRQLLGTLSSHHAVVFSVELTPEEMREARKIAVENMPRGVKEDTERTYLEVTSFEKLLESEIVDWSNLGMIAASLLGTIE